jgi:hypothetical protein
MAQAVELQGIRDGLGVGQVARLVDGLSTNPIGAVMLVMFLGGTVLGVVCLAVAMWRARVAPRPAVVLFLAFPFVDLLVRGEMGVVVSHTVLLAGLGWIGLTLMRPSWTAASVAGRDGDPSTSGARSQVA